MSNVWQMVLVPSCFIYIKLIENTYLSFVIRAVKHYTTRESETQSSCKARPPFSEHLLHEEEAQDLLIYVQTTNYIIFLTTNHFSLTSHHCLCQINTPKSYLGEVCLGFSYLHKIDTSGLNSVLQNLQIRDWHTSW